MRKALWIILAALFVAVQVPAAHADSSYTYSISGADSGTITITVNASDVITGVSGTFDGATILPGGLLTTDSLGNNDNLYSPTTVFDGAGLSFALNGNDSDNYDYVNFYDYSVFSGVPGTEYASNQGSCATFGCGDGLGPGHDFLPDTVTAVSTPEPTAFALTLSGLGLLGLLLALRKRAPMGQSQAS